MRNAVLLVAVLALGCDGATTCSDCVDAGDDDAGVDAGADVDAGDTDAGPPSLCPPGTPMPDAFDCTTATGPAAGEPIVADPMTWTWVGFPEAVCMNGSSTGIGVNINPASNNVLILLEGGGACFDGFSCAGVANPDGYGETKFTRDSMGGLTRGILDRSDAQNPLREWSFVYVPYCSGDVHGGTNPSGIGGRRFLGHQNFSWFLTRIVPTFPSAEMVLLTGRSAGGLGTIVNYEQTANAFGCTPVHVLNDAGGILPDAYLRPCLQRVVREVWGLDAVVPSDCPHCSCADGGGLVHVFPYAARRYPDRRFAFASAMEDATMRTFYGYGYSPGCNFPQSMPTGDYTAGLLAVRELVQSEDNFRTFYMPGDQHTFSYGSLGATSVGGTTLGAWLGAMLSGDAGWNHVGP